MTTEDIEFLEGILDKAHWLFYGDLDYYFDTFVRKVFAREFREWGFEEESMTPDFAVAYWLFLSELVALNLAEYGTSPRGAWLTPDGERFKKLCLTHEDAIGQVNEYIHKKYNG